MNSIGNKVLVSTEVNRKVLKLGNERVKEII
jgi:hypothetical protein